MSKSILYANNSASQTIAIGDTVNFSSIIRKYGCNCELSGGSVVVNGAGYYSIDSNITFTAGSAGTVVVELYQNGTPIAGATASMSVEASSIYSITIPTVVRTFCCAPSTIQMIVTGVAGTVTSASILVEKE